MAWTLDSDRPIFYRLWNESRRTSFPAATSREISFRLYVISQRKHPSTRTPCKRPLQNLNAPVWSIPGGPADVLSRRIVI